MIERWRVVMTNVNGKDIDLDADLPDDITERIDELIEAEYDVTWTGDGTT